MLKRLDTLLTLVLVLGPGLFACTGGQSGHEGAGLDEPGNTQEDAGPIPTGAGAGGDVLGDRPDGGRGPNDFGNRDGAIEDDDDAGGGDAGASDAGQVETGNASHVIDPAPPGNQACVDSSIDAPTDCLDACGTLVTCDPEIACDDCLERCAASPVGPVGGDRCLSRVVYLIDEEGCASMVRAYQAYVVKPSCGES